jgi:hypothetical protein
MMDAMHTQTEARFSLQGSEKIKPAICTAPLKDEVVIA